MLLSPNVHDSFFQMDDFEFDSFVVGNSEVEFESSFDELDLVDEFGSEDDAKRARFESR